MKQELIIGVFLRIIQIDCKLSQGNRLQFPVRTGQAEPLVFCIPQCPCTTRNGGVLLSGRPTTAEKKLEINSDVTLKAKAFNPGWIGSDILKQHFFKSTYRPDSVILITPTDKEYPGKGGRTIADIEKGDLDNFGDGKWIGYRANAMEAMMVFGKPVEARSVTISALKNLESFIFPPVSIEVWGGKS